LGFRKRISDTRRLVFILAVVFGTGVQVLAGKIRMKGRETGHGTSRSFSEFAVPEEHGEGVSPKEPPFLFVRLRQVLERLGPTFMKLGQVLSLRPDLVGEELAGELSRLQDRAAPFPYEDAEAIIKEDLGGPPEKLFAVFEARPFAAASLAQVHRAQLHDGTPVAVKIQRPGIRKVVGQDLRILLRLARIAERCVPEMRPYHPVLVVKEFADWTRRELDFGVEGHNADRFRFSFRKNPHVKVPRIHWDYTTPGILTMEFVEGAKIDDLAAIQRAGGDGKKVTLRLLESFVQQFLSDGFFHADPHPGNVFVLKENVLCFTDFGMVGYLDESIRRELLSCFAAFVNGDMEAYLKHFMHIAERHSDSDVAGFRKDAAEILNEIFFSRNSSSTGRLFFRLIRKGAARRMTFPTGLALFAKAIMTTESISRGLYAEFDFNAELPPYIQKAADDYLDSLKASRSLQSDMYDYLEFVANLPGQVKKALDTLGEDGRITVKIDSAQMLDMRRELDRRTDARTVGMLTVVVLAGSLLLFWFERAGGVPKPMSSAGFMLFVILFVWFLIKRKARRP